MATATTALSGKLDLQPNVPERIAIKYTTPRIYKSQFEGSPDQAMFSLVDGRVMYVTLAVGKAIEELQLGNREEFLICKYWSGKKGEQVRTNVWLTPEGEKARAIAEAGPDSPPFLLRRKPATLEGQLSESIRQVQEKKAGAGDRPPAPASAAPNTITSSAQPALDTGNSSRPKTRLEDALKTVVAAVHAANEYAKSIDYAIPQFTSEDLRTMANTIMMEGRR